MTRIECVEGTVGSKGVTGAEGVVELQKLKA